MPCSVGLRIAQHDSVSSHERDAYAVRLVSAYFFRDLIESVHVGDIELSPDSNSRRIKSTHATRANVTSSA